MNSSANQSSMRYEAGAAVTPFPARPAESRQTAPVHEVAPAVTEGTADEHQGGGSFTRIEPMKALIAVAVIAALGLGTWALTRNPSTPAVAAPAVAAAPGVGAAVGI